MELAIYGVYRQSGDWAGKTVAEVRQSLDSPWAMSGTVAYCGNTPMDDGWIIPKGAIIEFDRPPPRTTVACTECGIVVRVDGPDTYIFVASDPVLSYCGECWRHIHSPENRDEVVAELVEILASAAPAD